MRKTVALLALLLAACAAPTPAAPLDAPEPGFPVTITHGQGTVTIPARPRRVVALGFADAQIAAALNAPVVGVTRSTSSPDGNWPGVTPGYPAELITLDALTPNVEQLAALRPDLILMTTAQPAFAAAYDEISRIAPTISYRNALLEDDGAALVEMIGTALGVSDAARELIEGSERLLADVAAARPELAGATYAFGQYYSATTYLVVAPDGPTARFLAELGLSLPPELAALPIAQAGTAALPAEQLSLLDSADIAFLGIYGEADEQAFFAQPLAADLRLVDTGAFHRLTVDQAGLLLGPNPATTQQVIDFLTPWLDELAAERRG